MHVAHNCTDQSPNSRDIKDYKHVIMTFNTSDIPVHFEDKCSLIDTVIFIH